MNQLFNLKELWGDEVEHKKRSLLRWLTLVLIISVVYLSALAANTIKEFKYIGAGVPATNTIFVAGEGEVFAVPDIAEISFSARVEKKTVAEAQKEVTSKMNAAIDFVEKSGVAKKDIKTTGYNAYPRYEYSEVVCLSLDCPKPGQRILAGYEVTHTILVKVRDTEKAGDILDGLGKLKVDDLSGPNFSIDDDDKLKAEARKKAIADAKEKAEILARDLGVKLVRVVSFSESGDYPIYYGKAVGFGMGGDAESAPTPSIPKGENKITSNVSITYEIR